MLIAFGHLTEGNFVKFLRFSWLCGTGDGGDCLSEAQCADCQVVLCLACISGAAG